MIARTRSTVLVAAFVMLAAAGLAAALAACGGGTSASPAPSSPAPGASSAGTKMAPGLYDLEDGTVQAVGTVEFRDLEGGFWAVIGGTEAEGDVGKTVAVIANGADYAQQLEDLEGLSVIVTGSRLEGPSIRMAGPEIKATSVVAASAAGPAE